MIESFLLLEDEVLVGVEGEPEEGFTANSVFVAGAEENQPVEGAV